VCVGAHKHRIVHASINAGYVNVLATDAATARYLLEQDHE
jgi:deoxyribonucleoside regulator